uniref:ABC transporter B family member 4 n=1 Tax=Aegilops tauschii TaxID=37682 RepID=R7W9K8_AEGTA
MTTGQIVSRMSGDTVLVQDAIGEKVGKFQSLVATFVGGFIVGFVKGWLLSLVMLASIPPVVLTGAVVAKLLSKISSRRQASYSAAGNVVEQTIGAIKTVVSFNGEKQAITTYNKLIHKSYKTAVEEGLTNGFGMGSAFFALFSNYGLAIWYGGKLALTKGYTGGQVITVILAIIIGAGTLGNAAPCMTAFVEGQSAAHRLLTTIRRKPKVDPDDNNGKRLEDMRGEVELKDVYFSYPARPEQLIFDGFSLLVPSGTTMAIVGESGSGKSTVVSLVERFYDPHDGEVLIDGINIKSLHLDSIRGKIGLVSQEPVLFMTSIKDNITYGKEDATIEEIKRAAELANAAIFIDKLPNGYDTMVGQRGAQLSGGQKQRIAIARAIIKNPKILLLDEATSALDVESERIVQEALDRIMVDRTTLVVAHRLTTVRNADCISVVQQGKIVEQGSHDELVLNLDGAYSQLVLLQESHTEHKIDRRLSTPRSKSKSLSMKRSISGSIGNSSGHSFTLPFGLPSAIEFPGGNETHGQNQEELNGDGEVPKKAPMVQLALLNKPEIISNLVTGVVIAIIADWKLALIIICVIPLTGIQGYANVKFLNGFSQDAKQLWEYLKQVQWHPIQKKAKDSAVSVFALLDRKSEIDSSSNEGLTLDEVKGNIDFRHVSFNYPTRPDVVIFNNFTLHIPYGKTIALVGESGCGKSTVIALLERFYNPDSGTILLDGVEIKSLNINWLRKQTGLVSQEPVLFNDTIRANIAYGKDGEVSEEELIVAAKASNAHEFISSLPQGYATSVGERGIQLSGGQKQRVAIARAILKDPKILLLDEATSALDAESERIVQNALDHVMVGRTTVAVAHRLSTVKGADIIAVLKDGAIVEKGGHESLMNIKDGVYASLVELRSTHHENA